VARFDALADGVALLVDLLPGDAQTPPERTAFRMLLLRSGPDVSAFANRCAHLGVPLAARQDQLMYKPHTSLTCNVHYARYRWSDGVCDRGDCLGERLIKIPVLVDNLGCIRVATD